MIFYQGALDWMYRVCAQLFTNWLGITGSWLTGVNQEPVVQDTVIELRRNNPLKHARVG